MEKPSRRIWHAKLTSKPLRQAYVFLALWKWKTPSLFVLSLLNQDGRLEKKRPLSLVREDGM